MHCNHCNTDKSQASFYVSNKTRCKECVKAAVMAHRQANIDRIRAYDRSRGSMPHRVEARAEYQKTAAYWTGHKAATKRWYAKDKARLRAHNAVSKAILRGKLKPWPVCELPACNEKPEAHHPHYGAPLLVTWLCQAHHKEAHALLKKDV